MDLIDFFIAAYVFSIFGTLGKVVGEINREGQLTRGQVICALFFVIAPIFNTIFTISWVHEFIEKNNIFNKIIWKKRKDK